MLIKSAMRTLVLAQSGCKVTKNYWFLFNFYAKKSPNSLKNNIIFSKFAAFLHSTITLP